MNPYVSLQLLVLDKDGHIIGISYTTRDLVTDETYSAAGNAPIDAAEEFFVGGKPPRNEEDALGACQILVHALNQTGDTWGKVIVPDQTNTSDIDAHTSDEHGHTLEMQVVRVVTDQRLWKDLHMLNEAHGENDMPHLVKTIEAAINKKASKLAPAQKKKLTLVLDCTRTPVFSFHAVAQAFRAQSPIAADAAGFSSIWAVGPAVDLATRLA